MGRSGLFGRAVLFSTDGNQVSESAWRPATAAGRDQVSILWSCPGAVVPSNQVASLSLVWGVVGPDRLPSCRVPARCSR